MSGVLKRLPEQTHAADPARSVWVSANAGSGKTSVLADRVVRLLLGGTDPGAILCLTFTKAAAAEMENRVFDQLAKWATASHDQLLAELDAIGQPVPGEG
ncbi:MAG: UvrD-helicase domain-containing protein [Rhizobiales bacterium]|nr:UvrD-helicase domain-containing protein [Hyphomicrobiales bacterium]